jgi:hypothetical protein
MRDVLLGSFLAVVPDYADPLFEAARINTVSQNMTVAHQRILE